MVCGNSSSAAPPLAGAWFVVMRESCACKGAGSAASATSLSSVCESRLIVPAATLPEAAAVVR